MRYRLGRSHQDIVYRQLGDEPSDEDPRVAVFGEAIDAIAVVALLNGDDQAPADEPVSAPPPGEIKLIDYGPHPYGLGTIESVTPAGEPAPVPPPVDALLERDDDLTGESARTMDELAELIDDWDQSHEGWRAIRSKAYALWASGVAEGRRQRAGEVEELQVLLDHAEQYARDLQDNGDVPERTDRIAEIREWLRMHGDYDVRIGLWSSFSTIRIAVTYLGREVWSDIGTTWEKRLDLALAHVHSIDPPEGKSHG